MSFDPATVRAARIRKEVEERCGGVFSPADRVAVEAVIADIIIDSEVLAPEPSTDTLREALESLAAKLGIVATDFELDGHERAAAQFRELVAEANEALAATPAREDEGRCEHDWIDIRNEVIESGEMCSHCGALRAAPWQEGR
jgi:hypothetical protein